MVIATGFESVTVCLEGIGVLNLFVFKYIYIIVIQLLKIHIGSYKTI